MVPARLPAPSTAVTRCSSGPRASRAGSRYDQRALVADAKTPALAVARLAGEALSLGGPELARARAPADDAQLDGLEAGRVGRRSRGAGAARGGRRSPPVRRPAIASRGARVSTAEPGAVGDVAGSDGATAGVAGADAGASGAVAAGGVGAAGAAVTFTTSPADGATPGLVAFSVIVPVSAMRSDALPSRVRGRRGWPPDTVAPSAAWGSPLPSPRSCGTRRTVTVKDVPACTLDGYAVEVEREHGRRRSRARASGRRASAARRRRCSTSSQMPPPKR